MPLYNPSTNSTGVIRMPIGITTQTSSSQIPQGAIVQEASLEVATPYTGGTLITLGLAGGDPAAFMLGHHNRPSVLGIYQIPQYTPVATSSAFRATVLGSPSMGAGYAVVTYMIPDS